MLIVEDWAEIRRLRKSEAVSISEIARLMGCSRNTVKAALASDEPPRYERARSGSLVDAYPAVGWEMHLIFVTRLATKESQEYCVARVFHAGQKSNALCESWPPEPYGAQT